MAILRALKRPVYVKKMANSNRLIPTICRSANAQSVGIQAINPTTVVAVSDKVGQKWDTTMTSHSLFKDKKILIQNKE